MKIYKLAIFTRKTFSIFIFSKNEEPQKIYTVIKNTEQRK